MEGVFYCPGETEIARRLLQEQSSQQVPFPSPVSQHKHTATCRNQCRPNIHYLTCLHQAPHPPAWLTSVLAQWLPYLWRPAQTLPTLHFPTSCFAGPPCQQQWPVTSHRGHAHLVNTVPPAHVHFANWPGLSSRGTFPLAGDQLYLGKSAYTPTTFKSKRLSWLY